MVAVSGRAGSFRLDDGSAKTVGLCTEWNLDISTDTEVITAFGSSGWKERMYMMSEWTGSASVKWDIADAGQLAIQTKMLTPGSVTVKLYVDGTHYYSGTAYFKGWNIKNVANGIIEADVQFEGSGAVTYT